MAPIKIPGGNAQFVVTESSETYLLPANAALTVDGDHAILVGDGFFNVKLVIKGDVTQTGDGFAAIRTDGTDVTIRIDAGGSLTGATGITSENFEPSSRLRIENNGLIEAGDGFAIETFDTREVVINRGTIHGRIDLGSGDDIFDTRNGTIDHRVAGGTGDDTLIVSRASQKLQENGGSAGYDTVRSTVTYTLSENVERLVLIGKANTNGTGNDGQSDLYGNAGNNRLSALGGSDILAGGLGNDRLTGGGDFDTFVFKTKWGRDTITDFEDGLDLIDVSGWQAIRNFNDLKNNHLSFDNGNAIITAGSDQLILRNVDRGDLDRGDFLFS